MKTVAKWNIKTCQGKLMDTETHLLIKKLYNTHPYFKRKRGYCVFHPESGLAIVHIPKNASTSIRAATLKHPWASGDLNALAVKRFCVILRDPVDRFKSALNMYLGTSRSRILNSESNFVKFSPGARNTFSVTTNDEHFTPQCLFLIGVHEKSHIPVDYFYMKDTIINDISMHYGGIFRNQQRNTTLNKLIQQVDENIIRSAYKADYDLINNVEFVNHKL